MSTAFLFPGQGAQAVGMGQDVQSICAAAELFDQAEEISSLPLRKLCFEGPAEQLSRTDISQPAIFTASMALLAGIKSLLPPDQEPKPAFCAGLSLGEYTALCAAGAVSFADGLRLVTERGRLMQAAAEAGEPGGMVCLLGADQEVADKVCDAARGDGVLLPANFNCPGQIVLSGTLAACEKVAEIALECGASGVVPLDVAGAFHSPFMQPAADELAEILAGTEIRTPEVPVLSNVAGECHGNPDQIRQALVQQLTSPVLWQRNCEYLLAQGVQEYLEIGPGRVLAGLMRRINRKTRVVSLNGLAALSKYCGVEPPAQVP